MKEDYCDPFSQLKDQRNSAFRHHAHVINPCQSYYVQTSAKLSLNGFCSKALRLDGFKNQASIRLSEHDLKIGAGATSVGTKPSPQYL